MITSSWNVRHLNRKRIIVTIFLLVLSFSASATTWSVLNLDDSGADSFRQCLQNAGSGDIIQFNTGLAGTLTLTSGPINITSDVSIVGLGPAVISINGNSSSRIFTATNVSPIISGLTFSNGLANGCRNGGVLYQAGGNITFSNCVFMNNRAIGSNGVAGGFGGAIYTTGGVITAQGCVFSNNIAVGSCGLPLVNNRSGGGGGGAGVGGAVGLLNGTGYFYQCVFGLNSVTGGVGGTAGYGTTGQDGGHGGGPAGGLGGITGHTNGYDGGEFSGGGGGKDSGTTNQTGNGGNGGFGGGGGGGGGLTSGYGGGTGGTGGQYAGNGGNAEWSGGGGGGGGTGLGGAIFARNTAILCSNVSLTGNSAAGGSGGSGSASGANGTGGGGAIFCHGGSINMYLTTFSGNTANVHPDVYGVPTILGTNNTVIGNAENASAAKGTDFGTISLGQAITNLLAITNGCTNGVIISGVTTNGTGAASFQILGMPANVSAGMCSNFSIVFSPTSRGNSTCSICIANDSATTPYIVNLSGTVLPAPTENGWLAVNVTPATGSWSLTAPTGYTGPTSGTGNLAAVEAVTGQYSLAWGALSGYVAPSNQTGFVTGGNTTLFTAVYLQVSTNIGTPAGVSATEGTYTNRIRVTWQGVTGATGYEIWRSQTNDANTAVRIADIPLISLRQIAENLKGRAQQPVAPFLRKVDGQAVRPYLAGNTYYYDDYAVNPIYAYYYWVRAKTATLISPLSYVGAGYAALDPSRATGSADIGVSDFVFLPVNITNLSHPGTMSCWIQNHGADNLANSVVRMDVYMTNNATPAAWIGYAQTNLTLNAGEEKVIILSATDKQGMSIRADLNGTGQPEIHIRHLTTINDPNLANNTAYGAGIVTVKSGGVNSPARTINDYDGDGKSDLAICATNMSAWAVLLSGTRYRDAVVVESGHTDWIAVPGDYEGAGITGVGVYVPADEFWYVWFPSGGRGAWCFLGGMEYEPAQADYDGDNKTDPAVYLAAEGYWRGYESGHGYAAGETWVGGLGYEPVVRDYDGDGKADPMAYAERTGIWIGQLTGTQYGLVSDHFGGYGYQPVPADYDGDGRADPAVYEMATGTWYAWLSKYGYPTVIAQPFGGVGFLPIVGDYDGDGKADPAIYCETSGVWYGALSSRNYLTVYAIFGGIDYYPVSE